MQEEEEGVKLLTKDILIQYCDLRQEVKDMHNRIKKIEDQIKKIEADGAVIDSVKGGEGGIQNFKIMGFPFPEHGHKTTQLLVKIAKSKALENSLTEKINLVEEYIGSISDSRTRRMLRFRYVDGMTWAKVAVNMGGKTTDESIRKEHERFLGN